MSRTGTGAPTPPDLPDDDDEEADANPQPPVAAPAIAGMAGEELEKLNRLAYSTAWKIVHDHGGAKEAALDTVAELAVCKAVIDNYEAFVVTLATWRAIDWLRRERHRLAAERAVATELASAPVVEPHEVIEREVERQLVRSHLEALPQREREAVTLRYFESLTIFGVAEEMKISPNSVKTMLARAQKKLRASLQAAWEVRD